MLKTHFLWGGGDDYILHHNFKVECSWNNLTEYGIKIATDKFIVLI